MTMALEIPGIGEYRFYINNFKPIRSDNLINLRLGGVTILMGPRGVGKSSVIEALHLLEVAYQLYKSSGNSNALHQLYDVNEYYINYLVELQEYILSKDYRIEGTINYPVTLGLKRQKLYDLVNKYSGRESKAQIALCHETGCFGIEITRGEQSKINTIEPDKLVEIVNETQQELEPEDFPIIYTLSIERLQPFLANEIRNALGTFPGPLGYLSVQENLDMLLNYIRIKGIGPHGYLMESLLSLLTSRYGLEHVQILSEIYNQFLHAYNKILEYENVPYRLNSIQYDPRRNEVVLIYTINGSKEIPIFLSQLSRGTLNLMTMILQAMLANYFSKRYNKKYILALEEPEAALHSSALLALIKLLINMVSENNYLGVILTSHSYRLLAMLRFATQRKDKLIPSIVYVLKQMTDMKTLANEYLITDSMEIISASLESVSIDELELIHKILAGRYYES